MTFEFTIEQTNMILSALGNAPYVQVAALIAEIQKQAQGQVAQQSEVQKSDGQ